MYRFPFRAAAVSLFVALLPLLSWVPASGQPVVRRPLGITIGGEGAFEGLEIDVDGNAAEVGFDVLAGADFQLQVHKTFGDPFPQAILDSELPGVVEFSTRLFGDGEDIPRQQDAGDAVVTNGDWTDATARLYFFGTRGHTWDAHDTGFVGVRYNLDLDADPNNIPLHYGWLLLAVNNDYSVTLHEYAYSEQAGVPLTMGAGAVTEAAWDFVGVRSLRIGDERASQPTNGTIELHCDRTATLFFQSGQRAPDLTWTQKGSRVVFGSQKPIEHLMLLEAELGAPRREPVALRVLKEVAKARILEDGKLAFKRKAKYELTLVDGTKLPYVVKDELTGTRLGP